MVREGTAMTEPKEFADWTMSVLVAVTSHKAEAMRRGFTEEAAEAMAVTLHSVLMAGIYEEVDNPPEE